MKFENERFKNFTFTVSVLFNMAPIRILAFVYPNY